MSRPRKYKKSFGEITGTCVVCGINCWSDSNNKPAIWPCGIKNCPYPEGNTSIQIDVSLIGSGLAQIE